jgi:hypothetical protein
MIFIKNNKNNLFINDLSWLKNYSHKLIATYYFILMRIIVYFINPSIFHLIFKLIPSGYLFIICIILFSLRNYLAIQNSRLVYKLFIVQSFLVCFWIQLFVFLFPIVHIIFSYFLNMFLNRAIYWITIVLYRIYHLKISSLHNHAFYLKHTPL